tara:strand:- start:896 stop:1372 length:477 start_codon:yes stop_codon:yes gene_type:complete
MKLFQNIDLIIYDFDGVMTNNMLYLDQDSNEMVQLSRADGLGISEIKKLGFEQMIISTEKNPIVSVRANKLNIDCFQGVESKKSFLLKNIKKKFKFENILFVGNDINDEEAMKISGKAICPSDAHIKIKEISDLVLQTKGGYGVVRELLDIIINERNL